MTRTEAVKEFFKKAVLPVAIAGLLYCIFKSACMRDGELDLLWLWILCGLPFGIHRMCVWIVPAKPSLTALLRTASIGCACGSCGRGLPGRRRCPVCSELRDRRHHRRLRPGVAPAGGGMVCAPHHLPPDRGILRWTNDREPAGIDQPALLMVSAPE